MHKRLGTLLTLAVAISVTVVVAAAPAGADPTPAPAPAPVGATPGQSPNGPGAGLLPRLSHGVAVQALQTAHELLAPRSSADGRRVLPFRDATPALRDLWQARPSLHGADRRLADRLLTSPMSDTTHADRVSLAAASGCSTSTCVVESRHFDVVFTSNPLSANRATTTYAVQVARTLEHVYATEVGTLGYKHPLIDPSEPNHRIEIDLRDLRSQGLYGYCSPTGGSPTRHSPAYCVLDNDFVGYPSSPTKSLKVTAAHEFFHAIQYAYDTGEDKWLMEGTAVWMEDEVYNSINDYYQYLPVSPIRHPQWALDFDGTYSVYGDFAFFKFLTRYLGSRKVVRQIWQHADATHPGVYSLRAVREVITQHHRNPRKVLAMFGAWNTLPRHTYPERSAYKPAHFWATRTVTRSHPTGTLSVRLLHLSSAPLRLYPGKRLGSHRKVVVRVNAPRRARGAAATYQVRFRDGRLKMGSFRLNKWGNGRHTYAFGHRQVASVVIVLTNGSTRMHDCGDGYDYSCGGRGVDDNRSFAVKARVA
ncbi:MXAN_6640 family putative metalloprotease [Nocardioides terrisoli]|uniref:MXAN_6640 family putative metalloprotease n=1 Tax=Nocardioides terrisoli TaxID=3388267 RepID=UPI00287B7A41|nr:MXAN_6640 family putative metalloprotease [Nocardioides marmorisolisilvae]